MKMKTAKEFADKYYQLPDSEITSVKIKSAIAFAEAYHEDKTSWISVEETKPEFGEPVFVWCRIYGRYIGTYQQIDGTRFGNWSDGKDLGVLPPLFWQPLPTPPKINAE